MHSECSKYRLSATANNFVIRLECQFNSASHLLSFDYLDKRWNEFYCGLQNYCAHSQKIFTLGKWLSFVSNNFHYFFVIKNILVEQYKYSSVGPVWFMFESGDKTTAFTWTRSISGLNLFIKCHQQILLFLLLVRLICW